MKLFFFMMAGDKNSKDSGTDINKKRTSFKFFFFSIYKILSKLFSCLFTKTIVLFVCLGKNSPFVVIFFSNHNPLFCCRCFDQNYQYYFFYIIVRCAHFIFYIVIQAIGVQKLFFNFFLFLQQISCSRCMLQMWLVSFSARFSANSDLVVFLFVNGGVNFSGNDCLFSACG